jgi:asparagine synthase (glutamine-hydrolysing)
MAQSKRFRELFFDAIRIRLRSDVPIGTCLSGGFDSSAITCAIAEIMDHDTHEAHEARSWRHAFIGSFPGQDNDETAAALEVAAYAGVESHVTVITDADALQHITEVLQDLDDVYISLPTAPWQIYRELRCAKVVVSLDGHGADELMGGYRDGSKVFGFMLRNQLASLASHSPLLARAIESAKLAYLSLKGLNFVRGHRWSAPRGHGTPFDSDKLPAHWGGLNRRLYWIFHARILPTILRNFDRMSMAHGIEVRMPFMDWRLVTYVMSLPDSAKADTQRSKLVARDAMAGKMPENIRTDTRKVGFNSPMPGWMNGPLAPWIERLLGDEDPAFSALVDVPALRYKVHQLTLAQAWDWHSVGRLWPYIHLKWYIDEVINATRQVDKHVS